MSGTTCPVRDDGRERRPGQAAPAPPHDDAVTPGKLSEHAVRERVAELESGLGDPVDPHNPLGFGAFLEADRRGAQLAPAEKLLDDLRLPAEIVPHGLGGRMTGQDTLARVLRPVFRRDAALGLAHVLTPYLAAAVVWAGGSVRQRQETAELLLACGRMAYAYPQPVPGNVFLQNGLVATRQGTAHLLDGRKDAMNNAARARSLVLFARTVRGPAGEGTDGAAHGDEAGHSAFLVPGPADPASPERTGMTLTSRRHTSGVRGCLVQGVRFTGHRLSAGSLIGTEGEGLSILGRVFPLVRSAGPSMVLGCADTALRTAASFVLGERRRACGRVPSRTERAGRSLAHAFADLLACDCLALAATRAVHLLPGEGEVLGAAVKYLLPTVLDEAVHELSGVLGGASYAAEGPYAVFRKMARDLHMTGLGAAGSAVSREVIERHLLRSPALGAPPGGGASAGRLFRPGDPALPPWRPEERLPPVGCDTVLSALDDTAALLRPGGDGEFTGALGELAAALAAELTRLRRWSGELAGAPQAQRSPARMCALADRYAHIAAGAACLRVWAEGVRRSADGFLAGPAWALMALSRILRRLDSPAPRPPGAAVDRLVEEVVRRHDDGRSYDLYGTRIGR